MSQHDPPERFDAVRDAIEVLANEFLDAPENDLDDSDLERIFEGSVVSVFRLLSVSLFESTVLTSLSDTEPRAFYPLDHLVQGEPIGSRRTGLDGRSSRLSLWSQLQQCFELFDPRRDSDSSSQTEGSVPTYSGSLFQTKPTEDERIDVGFLTTQSVEDGPLRRVIDLLAREQSTSDGSSLGVRHLGRIYEHVLEYELAVASDPLTVQDGEYVTAGEGDEVVVAEGEAFLQTGSGQRKVTGSYYTPEHIVSYVVEQTLGPLIEEIHGDLSGTKSPDSREYAEAFADRLFDLTVLDPAMGTGFFLIEVLDYLTDEVLAVYQSAKTTPPDVGWIRQQVADRCLYGVDLNPLAVELAHLTLWMCVADDGAQPTSLGQHLITGNSLVGTDREEFEAILSDVGAFESTLSAVDNFDGVRAALDGGGADGIDEIRTRLEAIAHVHTAKLFGLERVPENALSRLASALKPDVEPDTGDWGDEAGDDEFASQWARIESEPWFKTALEWAATDHYVHWWLAFPDVCWGADTRGDSGFDAVVGNPPYVRQERIARVKDYLERTSAVYHGRADISAYFVERGLEQLRAGGRFSYVLSHKFTTVNSGGPLRSFLTTNCRLERFVDFQDLPVFGQAVSAYPAILVASNRSPRDQSVSYAKVETLAFDSLEAAVESVSVDVPLDSLGTGVWTFQAEAERRLKQKLTTRGVPLREVIGDPLVGVKTGLNDVLVVEEATRDEIVGESDEGDLFRPILFGREIKRFEPPSPTQYVVYPYRRSDDGLSVVSLDDYPNTRQYLERHRDELSGRAIVRDKAPSGEMAWYELQQVNEAIDPDEATLVYPDITKRAHFTLDSSTAVLDMTGFVLQTSDRYYLGVLNSSLLEWYLASECAKARGGYLRPKAQYVGALPLVAVAPARRQSDGAGDGEETFAGRIESLSGELLSLTAEFEQLDSSLLTHLGSYEPGPKLGESSTPVAEVSESPVTDTTRDRDGLRIGRVSVSTTESGLVLSASARYKPASCPAVETDRWGYVETDLEPVLRIEEGGALRRTVIEEFVPIAVERGGGFAEFRGQATATVSILDRLQAILLPDVNTCEPGVNAFREAQSRAAEIQRRIEQAEEELDSLVYQLYGLSDDEVRLVETWKTD